MDGHSTAKIQDMTFILIDIFLLNSLSKSDRDMNASINKKNLIFEDCLTAFRN